MTVELLRGYRVLDVSSHGAVPIAGSILADWGADVIKVEDPEHGDIIRGGTIWGVPTPPGGVGTPQIVPPRMMSPCSGSSTLMTSAPQSARMLPAIGTAPCDDTSRTR